jgi:hypothetical protein
MTRQCVSERVYPNVAKAEGAADARRPIRQAQGEAVVVYADPLRTQQMLYHWLSRRVSNMAVLLVFWISLVVHSIKYSKRPQRTAIVAFLNILPCCLCNYRGYDVI